MTRMPLRWPTLILLACGACGASDPSQPPRPDAPWDQDAPPAPFREHLTANINGSPFAAQLVLGEQVGDVLRFQSDQSQERQLFFVLPAAVAPGTYALVDTPGFSARYAQLFDGEYETQTGSLTVVSHDAALARVAGTFAFTASAFEFGKLIDTVEVTEGSFEVEYWVLEP